MLAVGCPGRWWHGRRRRRLLGSPPAVAPLRPLTRSCKCIARLGAGRGGPFPAWGRGRAAAGAALHAMTTRQSRAPTHCSLAHHLLLKPSRRPAALPRQRSSSKQRSCSNGGSVPQQRRGGPPAAHHPAADPGAAAQLQQLGLRGAAAPGSQQPFAARRRCVRRLQHSALGSGSGLGGGGWPGSGPMTCRVAHTPHTLP